jgi:hypothetical protein
VRIRRAVGLEGIRGRENPPVAVGRCH